MTDARRIATAELLAVGSELLVGETRDTNSGDLALELTRLGVEVGLMSALPDRLDVVVEALRAALGRSDLVITTGGLGPTPDDLTREAIAEVAGGPLTIDPTVEAWLRDRFARRGIRFSESNLKQAWRIPSSSFLENPNGTAPGWWVDVDGQVIVALPGPPSEMRPMWHARVLPRLHERGLGIDRAAETLRLTGIGESLVVDLVGEERLRGRQPEMATYARTDAVDLRVSATSEPGHSARAIVDAAVAELLPSLEPYLFARGDEGWPDAIARRLAGRTVAICEIGTGGQLGAVLGAADWLTLAQQLGASSPSERSRTDLRTLALRIRSEGSADVGLAMRARPRRDDLAVTIAVADGERVQQVRRVAFLGGEVGRRRAANLACAVLWSRLGHPTPRPRIRRAPPGA